MGRCTSHFDRERIPERVVHARGFVAHGEFEAYGTIGDEPAATYTRAKLFQVKGMPVFFIRDAIKFPDVIHSLKPDPVTFRQEPNRIFDFMSNTPSRCTC